MHMNKLVPLCLILFTLISFACSSPLPSHTLYIPTTPPSFFRSPSTEPQVSESIKRERRRARSFTEVNIKLQGTAGRERERKREIEEGRASPPSLIRRIDQPGMRVIYYFDKIRSSDAHRYPRRSISFSLSLFSFSFFPSAVGTLHAHLCFVVSRCVCKCD